MTDSMKQNRSEFRAEGPPDSAVAPLFGDPGPVRAFILLAFLTTALLLPFAGKAFHIDDPVFLRIARQITEHPLDPYGARMNWYGREMPMSQAMDNPPLASYYIAAVAACFGWSESVLHIAFLPFPIAFVLGTYMIARRCESPPVLAALAGLCSPALLVSSTNIMCDTIMASLYVWSLAVWIEGVARSSPLRLLAACLLISLAALTKYYAVSAIPLMAAYTIAKRRRGALPLLFLVSPLAVMLGYELWTAFAYDHGLMSRAAEAAISLRRLGDQNVWEKIVTGLSFTGAVIPSAFFLSPRLFSSRLLAVGGGIAVAAVLLLVQSPAAADLAIDPGKVRSFVAVELVLLILSGLATLALGMTAWRPGAGPEMMLLMLWVLGTFLYSSFVNWTINEPPLMLVGPPAAILLSRRLAARGAPSVRPVTACLAAAALLSLAVSWGDYCCAGAGRTAAERVSNLHRPEGSTVWFQGHWGFQYYMEQRGARPVDVEASFPVPGDLVVVPNNNTNIYGVNHAYAASLEVIELRASSWVTTMHCALKAGFYSNVFGPVPFVFGPIPLERCDIITYREAYRAQQ